MPNDWEGRRVTVMGLGRFGGGVGVVRWLALQGARVTLTDQETPESLAEPLVQLRDLEQLAPYPVKFHLGGHDMADFADAELLVVNPAVRPDNRWVCEARRRGVPVTTEIGLFLDACPASTIGVTGSNGKSTTSAMITSILRADGRKTWLGGNLGGSLLGELASMTERDWVVLELSSFQITYLPDTVRAPKIVVVTNCVPNHLDWHDTFVDYAAAKRRLLELQTPDSTTILSPTLAEWVKKGSGIFFRNDPEDASQKKFLTPFFPHDRENAQAAALAAMAAGCSDESIERGLMTYVGLPGRLEPIGFCHGRRCVNDTAATTPESTIAATIALPSSWFLVGGGDKGADFSAMLTELARSARGVAFYGVVGPRLYERFQEILRDVRNSATNVLPSNAALFNTLDEAFSWSLAQSKPGETILLSPGCSSHDQFTNFVARGEHFKRLVQS